MHSDPVLEEEDQFHIRALFEEQIVPRLSKLEARTGTLNCAFAGERFRNWNLVFRSRGSSFEIVDWEYDPQGAPSELDL